jgi:hypothetical protein
VDEKHRALDVADVARAAVGLGDLATVDLDGDGVRASVAAEEGCDVGGSARLAVSRRANGLTQLHVRDDGRRTDDETLDADDLVDVCTRLPM